MGSSRAYNARKNDFVINWYIVFGFNKIWIIIIKTFLSITNRRKSSFNNINLLKFAILIKLF